MRIALGLACLAALLLTGAARPVASDAYSSAGVVLSEFPDADLLAAAKTTETLRGKQSPGVQAVYSEMPDSRGRLMAVIECRAKRQCYLSMMYYSPRGRCYLRCAGLSNEPEQVLYLTQSVAAREPAGLVRLIAWSSAPSLDTLLALMRTPNRSRNLAKAALSDRWFKRQKSGGGIPPWIDPFNRQTNTDNPSRDPLWPGCSASLEGGGELVVKDCAIGFKGMTDTVLLEYGIGKVWNLSWSMPLTIDFEWPAESTPYRAVLVLGCDSSDAGLTSSAAAIEVTVNGWRSSALGSMVPNSQVMQPFSLPLSPYIVQGENRIEVRLNAMSNASLPLHGINIWFE
jgi:hypothetical protein